MAVDQNPAPLTIVEFVERRQIFLKSKIQWFFMATSAVSVLGATISFVGSSKTAIFKSGPASTDNPGIAFVISLIAFILSQAALWFFAVLALAFPIFVAIFAYASSGKLESPISTNSYKWFQLGISTILPLALFSVAWTSLPEIVDNTSPVFIVDQYLFMTVAIGSLVVAAAFYFINALLSKDQLNLRFSLYSFTLYAAILFSFGRGSEIYSYSALFGTLIYLTIDSRALSTILYEIAIYDLDNDIAAKVREIVAERDKTVVSASEERLRQQRLLNKKNEAEQGGFKLRVQRLN